MQGHATFFQCLLAAVGGKEGLVTDPSGMNYTAIVDSYRYNFDYPSTPKAIVYPETVDQVAATVKCAAGRGVKVQARSGGHSYGNYAIPDGELTVSMANLNSFSFDESTGLATIGAGMPLGSLNEALWNSNHSCVPHGVSFEVGVGGHATVGGFGSLSRKAGLILDHILEAQIVLANSSIVRASASQNPDLFFAIRGAGASFGIVTEFVLSTLPAPTSVISYTYVWATSDSTTRAGLIQAWQSLMYDPALPWELSGTLSLGSGSAIFYGTYVGTQGGFEMLNVTRGFTAPDTASVQTYTDYRQLSVDWDALLLQAVAASRGYFYAKSLLWTQGSPMADEALQQLVQDMDSGNTNSNQTGAQLSLNFEVLGGYSGAVPATATAFPYRDARFAMLLYARTDGPVSQATVQTLNELENTATGTKRGPGEEKVLNGRYAGFVDPKIDAGEARRAYWGLNLEKLSAIKAVVDPNDVFHNPQSVRPAAPAREAREGIPRWQ